VSHPGLPSFGVGSVNFTHGRIPLFARYRSVILFSPRPSPACWDSDSRCFCQICLGSGAVVLRQEQHARPGTIQRNFLLAATTIVVILQRTCRIGPNFLLTDRPFVLVWTDLFLRPMLSSLSSCSYGTCRLVCLPVRVRVFSSSRYFHCFVATSARVVFEAPRMEEASKR
jgi:hypothetical protein